MSSGHVTPKFSADALGRHTDYIRQLSDKYANLRKLVLDEHSSEFPSAQADEDRILALRGRIQDAWSRADGNPSSGKWVALTRLLRIGATSGRAAKWVGARADIKSPECPVDAPGWLSTTSESDWKDWERKFVQDQRLKTMVETWKKGIEVTTPQVTNSNTNSLSLSKGKQKELDPLRDSAPFGFGVVKRPSQTHVLSSKPQAAENKLPPEPSAVRLSFSGSQIVTSTPKQIAKPITSRLTRSGFSSLTPLTSSPAKRALLGRASSLASPPKQNQTRQNEFLQKSSCSHPRKLAASLPVIPSHESSLRHTPSQLVAAETQDLLNANNKRTLGSSHSAEADGRKSKKPKQISDAKEYTPQTPPRDQHVPTAVPTLTELLASVKKAKRKRQAGVKPQISDKKDLDNINPPFISGPRLNPPGSSGGKEKVPVDDEELAPFFDPSPVDDSGGTNNIHDSKVRAEEPEYDFYSHINDIDIASPAKSLSSIAGDVEDGVSRSAFVLGSSFRPFATSTQVQSHRPPVVPDSRPEDPPGPSGGTRADSWESLYAFQGPSPTSPVKKDDSSYPPLSYNSEFDSAVAAQVEKVNRLLQRDVDYGGLLSSGNRGREGDGDDSGDDRSDSPSYGYGKAFEYEQSF